MKALFPALLFAVMMSAVPPLAQADEEIILPAERPTIPMVHTRWLVRDGAPPNIQGLAQTPDGWIWIASSAGLFRFDGVSFDRYHPPAGMDFPTNIRSIGVLRDGTLWIGPTFGPLYFLRGKSLQRFDPKTNPLPSGGMRGVVQEPTGQIWSFSTGKLFQLNGDQQTWRNACAQPGLPEDCMFYGLFVDSRGTMWLKGQTGIYARRSNEERFRRVADAGGLGEFSEAPDGSIWAGDLGERGLQLVYAERDDPRRRMIGKGQIPVERFLIDRRGNFWLPMVSGLLRAEMNGKAPQWQGYTQQTGLSAERSNEVMEDREGNVWVATDSGLDQFRASRMTEIPLPYYPASGRSLQAGLNGDLWIDQLYLPAPDAEPRPFGPVAEVASMQFSLHRDRNGIVWSGAVDGLWRIEGRKRTRVPLPPAMARVQRLFIVSIALDAEDGLWVLQRPAVLWRLKDGIWTLNGNVPELNGFAATTIVPSADGALWFGATGNALAVLREGKVRKLGRADGIDIGTVLQIVPNGNSAYLGGEDGIAFFDGRRVTRINASDGEPFPTVSGLVPLPNGDLWANTGRGLIGIAASELKRAIAEPGYRVRYQRFDENDGLRGTAPALVPLPSMVRTPAGELVISTTSSVFRFDPARHPTNRVVPPVYITAVSDGHADYRDPAKLRLSSSPDKVRISYTALSLSLPHRVHFRYRLDGVDKDWIDAGPQRSASYTRLAPGSYTFRVIAANDDGLWNETGAQVAFEIPPTLTQTVWFKLACAVALALAAWSGHRLRLRIALKRLALTFEARVAERERIARDLHDTLLQSVQGLLMVFQNIAMRTPDREPTRRMMEDALAIATQVVEEGRDKVSGLRRSTFEGGDLASRFQEIGRGLAPLHPAEFTVTSRGEVRPLRREASEELHAIGREAIRNAFVHAHARHIGVELIYGDKMLELVVRDDGRGIDERYREGRSGHWGIQGIRERAAQLGASCDLSSEEGEGTVWRFGLAAAIAYLATQGVATVPEPRHLV